MTPPKERATCPICEYKYSCLGKHLTTRHFIKNKVERRLLINYGTGRVNFRHLPCPVPGCGFAKTRVDRHLEEGHPELDRSRIQEFVQEIKKKVTLDGLRQLRASNPNPPVISNLDIGTDHEEIVYDCADDVQSSCSQCTKYEKEIKDLRHQAKLRKRWEKRAKARIQALEQALQKAGGAGDSGDSGDFDLPCGQEVTQPEPDSSGEEEASEKPSKKAISNTVAKVFRDFPAPILEFMDGYWVHLRGALSNKKHQENQRSKLGRVHQFLQFMSQGRTILPNWTFLENIKRVHEWPEHLHQEGKAITTIKLYLLNVSEFLVFFRDTPPSTSRVSKKSMVVLLRAFSQLMKKLAKHVVLRQIFVKKKKASKLIPKADLHTCKNMARKTIPQLLDAIDGDPSPLNIRRFYGYFSAYFASLYGHRTGVLTNMTVSEVEEAKSEAQPGEEGFVVNVKEHKTNKAFGPAQLYFTVEEFCWLEQWTALRKGLNPATELVFFNENGQKLNNLQLHLQCAWSEMGLSGSPTFTDLRSSIATYARNVLSPGTRTKVSKTMCHNTDTAEKFYAMCRTTKQMAELRACFQEATDPDAPSSSDSAEPRLLVLSESSSEDEGEAAGKEAAGEEAAGEEAAGEEAAGEEAAGEEAAGESEELIEDEGEGAGAGAGAPVEKKNMSGEPVESWDSDHSYSKPGKDESEDESSVQDSPAPSPAKRRKRRGVFDLPKISPMMYYRLRKRSLRHTPRRSRQLRPRSTKK